MNTPKILQGPYGLAAQAKRSRLDLATTAALSGHTGHRAIGLGDFLVDEGYGLRGGVDADVTGYSYIVDEILLSDGLTPKTNQYLTATEAGSGLYKIVGIPVGGLILEMEEDAVGGTLTDTNLYYTLAITAPADTGESEKLSSHAAAHPTIKIDSSTGGTSSTSKVIEIITNGLQGIIAGSGTSPAWSTGNGRVFRCKFVTAAAAQSQS